MAAKPLPDQALLLKLLRYNPETGKLYWRERTPSDYAHTSNPERHCRAFNSKFRSREAFAANDKGYKITNLKGFGKMRAHRIIWCMVYGRFPDQIDHINQDKGDNRLANLRETSREGNARNVPLGPRNKSGRIGVNWSEFHQMWRAKIRNGGQDIELGLFSDFSDACAARSDAESMYGYSPLHGMARVRKFEGDQ